ncbi:uncharacterized protein LOC111130154 isoform X2 [Crassostrea virginica]
MRHMCEPHQENCGRTVDGNQMSSKERFPLESTEMSDPCITRVLVLGGTGHGKSSFINAMIGGKCSGSEGLHWKQPLGCSHIC